jgi:hypothetical protein
MEQIEQIEFLEQIEDEIYEFFGEFLLQLLHENVFKSELIKYHVILKSLIAARIELKFKIIETQRVIELTDYMIEHIQQDVDAPDESKNSEYFEKMLDLLKIVAFV